MSQENVVHGVRCSVSLPTEGAARRRGLDERLFVRFPDLYRLFADAWMRLPLRSRLRRLFLRNLVRAPGLGRRRSWS